MDKKGFEIQFNWLFILVAGAAILLFFTAVIIKQKSVSETSTKATVLKSIEAIIIGAGVSTDTTSVISVPNSNIEVSCGQVSVGGISKQYQNLILFAPSVIKGDKLITQTLAFNAPYRATNLLYITSPQLRYIIIGDNSLAKFVNKTMPVDLKKEYYSSAPQIKNSNNYKIKFVIFGEMIEFPKDLESLEDSDVTAVRFIGDAEKGTLEFYQKDKVSWQSKGTSNYIGKASLIGAVYTDTIEIYDCNMQDALKRLNLVTKIYIDKSSELEQKEAKSSKEETCNNFYKDAMGQLSTILAASSVFNPENTLKIANSAKELSGENLNLQVHSCALIY